MFTDYLRSQADRRREAAEKHPEDARNAQSARALDALAEHVDTKPGDFHPHALEVLERQIRGEGTPSATREVGRAVARFGFGSPVANPAQNIDFIDELAVLAVIDAYEAVASGGSEHARRDEHLADPEGHALKQWEVEATLDGVTLDRSYFARRRTLTEAEQREWISVLRAEERERRQDGAAACHRCSREVSTQSDQYEEWIVIGRAHSQLRYFVCPNCLEPKERAEWECDGEIKRIARRVDPQRMSGNN